MRGLLLVLFLIVFSRGAKAAPYLEIESLSPDHKEIAQKARKSIFGLHADLHCTAVFIGTQGEALTNLHCIEQCLVDTGATTEKLAYENPVYVDPKIPERKLFLKKMIVSLKDGHPTSCAGSIVQDGKQSNEIEFEVIKVFGPGFLYPKTLVSDLTKIDLPARNALLSEGFEGNGDLALIKIRNFASDCLKIKFENFLDKHESILNLAYTRARRNGRVVGDRTRPIASLGEATRSRSFFSELDNRMFEAIVPDGTILTSTDAEIGASGSPLINERGELVALTRATYNQGTFQEWSSHAIDLSYHSKDLSHLISDLNLCN